LHELGGDAVLGVIGLNPELVTHNVDVHERMVDAFVVVPAERNQHEAAA
jgi:hypothetical protein